MMLCFFTYHNNIIIILLFIGTVDEIIAHKYILDRISSYYIINVFVENFIFKFRLYISVWQQWQHDIITYYYYYHRVCDIFHLIISAVPYEPSVFLPWEKKRRSQTIISML